MRMRLDWIGYSLPWLRNRYVLTSLFGLVWVTFVSEIDLIYLFKSQRELNRLRTEVRHYEGQIVTTSQQLEALTANPDQLEKFAREHYFMKREHEDVFRIVPARGVQAEK